MRPTTVLVPKFHRLTMRLIFALERFTGWEGLFAAVIIYFPCCKRVLKGSLNPISQRFLTLNPSPSNEVKKKSQSRLLLCSFWNLFFELLVKMLGIFQFPLPTLL